jgi:hypothetical protein
MLSDVEGHLLMPGSGQQQHILLKLLVPFPALNPGNKPIGMIPCPGSQISEMKPRRNQAPLGSFLNILAISDLRDDVAIMLFSQSIYHIPPIDSFRTAKRITGNGRE